MDKQQREMQAVLDRQDRLERRGDTIYLSLSGDILFATDSSQLYPGGEDTMREIAGILQRDPRSYVEIVGHTDSQGAESYNMQLSDRRATAVADALATGASPVETLRQLRAWADVEALMLVGHEPTLSRLAALLLTGSPDGAAIEMKKGACLALEIDRLAPPGGAALAWRMPPRALRLVGR
jgi:phosphohistidine phosphatase SixA